MTNAVHSLLDWVSGVLNTQLWPWSVGYGRLWSASALDLHCGFTAAPKWLHWVSFLITTLSPHFSPLSSRYRSSMDSMSQLHRAQPQLKCFVIQLSERGSVAWNISWDGQSSVPAGTTQPPHYDLSVYNSAAVWRSYGADAGPVMFWLRARALWDTAKLVKMTSSICWATFNQDCYLVFSTPEDRPSHWNYSLADRARASRLSVCVLTGPASTKGSLGNTQTEPPQPKTIDRWVSFTSIDENATQF